MFLDKTIYLKKAVFAVPNGSCLVVNIELNVLYASSFLSFIVFNHSDDSFCDEYTTIAIFE